MMLPHLRTSEVAMNDQITGGPPAEHVDCLCTTIAGIVARGRNTRGLSSGAAWRDSLDVEVSACHARTKPATTRGGNEHLTVFPARRIITMEPGMPTASAVAVSGDRIVAVGSMESLQPWMDAHSHRIDDTFRDKILLPGLIDPHLHPWLIALLLSKTIVAPEAWDLPAEYVEAVLTRQELFSRLRQVHQQHETSEPLIAWGWNPYFHGPLTRQDLNAISPDTPLVVWHRSFHEIVFNDAGLAYFCLTPKLLPDDCHEHASFERGHFWEKALWAAFAAMAPYLFEEQRIREGFELARQLMHRGGVTTAADMLAGSGWDFDLEWKLMRETFDNDQTPFRLLLCPCPHMMEDEEQGPDEVFDFISRLPKLSTHRLMWMNAVKSFADGAFISQLMQLTYPGYIDGHRGTWITQPSELKTILEPYWREDFDVYHHVNGDLGLDVTLDVLEELLTERYRADPIFDLHHFGISREDQIGRIARLGATVSTNGYYLYLFGDKWSQVGIGHERASQMTRHGSLARHGVRFTMHSDCPMGPIKPLLAVQTAVTRMTASGSVLGPEHSVTLDQALSAVTIDAARSLRMEAHLGSIATGKKADFTVLLEDPYAVGPDHISDIPLWGTVFEGQLHPL